MLETCKDYGDLNDNEDSNQFISFLVKSEMSINISMYVRYGRGAREGKLKKIIKKFDNFALFVHSTKHLLTTRVAPTCYN